MTKARRRAGPHGPTYIVDTSTWIDLGKRADLDAIWALFLILISERRLFTAPEVLREIKHPDYLDSSAIYQRLRPYERDVTFRRSRDQEFHNILGDLHHRFRQLCKTTHRTKRPGDPYVIATAKRCQFIVVSEETLAKRPSRKIPNACVKLGVKCYTLSELMASERTLFSV
jgi:hypothetical protein